MRKLLAHFCSGCAVLLATVANAEYCPPGPNLADTDGNGLLDYACVGDWNANGQCEMEDDIRAAIDGLDDPGAKLVDLSDCSFSPPAVSRGKRGILELPSYTTLAGRGAPTTRNGFAETDLTSTQAVIANDDHAGGNTHIVIRGG